MCMLPIKMLNMLQANIYQTIFRHLASVSLSAKWQIAVYFSSNQSDYYSV